MYLWIALSLLLFTLFYKIAEGFTKGAQGFTNGAEGFTNGAEGFTNGAEGFTTTIVDSPAVDVLGSTIKLPNQIVGTVGDDITFGGNVRITDANEIELGSGLEKEGNAGKIAYNKWGENQLDVIGAGTDKYNRKINLWDDVEVAGDLLVKGPLAIGSDVSGNPGSLITNNDDMKRTDIKGYGKNGSRKVKLWDNAEVGFLDVKDGVHVGKEGEILDATVKPNENYGVRMKKGLDVSGELNANDRVYLKSKLTAYGGAEIEKGMTVNDLLQANDGLMVKDVVDANDNGVIVKKRLVVNDILDANDKSVSINKPLDVNNDLNVDGDLVIGKGANKWIISVGNRGQLEFVKDKKFINRRDDKDKGHIVMEQDGNIWMSRSKMRGYIAENLEAVTRAAKKALSFHKPPEKPKNKPPDKPKVVNKPQEKPKVVNKPQEKPKNKNGNKS